MMGVENANEAIRSEGSTMHIEIKKLDCDDTIFSGDYQNIKAAVEDANRSGISLRWADLSCASLSGADLTNADLSRANLIGADLNNADLGEANLCGAILAYTNMSGANLTNADLSETDLNKYEQLMKAERDACEQLMKAERDALLYELRCVHECTQEEMRKLNDDWDALAVRLDKERDNMANQLRAEKEISRKLEGQAEILQDSIADLDRERDAWKQQALTNQQTLALLGAVSDMGKLPSSTTPRSLWARLRDAIKPPRE